MTIEIIVPGEPVAQGRPRAFSFRGKDGRLHTRVYDPAASRSWKSAARIHMRAAIERYGRRAPAFPLGPVHVEIEAVFACPRSHCRKRPVLRREKCTRSDNDNIEKAIFDAGTGILWTDDGQISKNTTQKWIGAQDEAPYVKVIVRAA